MIVNIAFNTIIYIMVFLFPGVIFRRLYFSGKIRNKFDSGSNFERILWGILLSIFCIAAFCSITIILNDVTNNFISSHSPITENQVICVFEEIYRNQYPSLLQSRDSLLTVFIVFISLYCFSAFSGWFVHKFIYSLKLDKYFSFLQFANQWEFFTESNKLNNDNHKFGDRAQTQLDLKTKNGSLFTGTYKQFIISDDNSIESIVLKDAYKYYTLEKSIERIKIEEIKKEIASGSLTKIEHIENSSVYIYKKRIEGNLFLISKDEVEDISIRYITFKNIFDKKLDVAKSILTLSALLLVIMCAINAVWDLGIFNFVGIYRRIVFSIVFILNILFIISIIVTILAPKEERAKNKYVILDSLVWLIYFVIPYIYILAYIRFNALIVVMVLLFPVIATISTRIEKSKKNNSSQSIP